jgi:hypothetical protein
LPTRKSEGKREKKEAKGAEDKGERVGERRSALAVIAGSHHFPKGNTICGEE